MMVELFVQCSVLLYLLTIENENCVTVKKELVDYYFKSATPPAQVSFI
jgi:hypothetical protein